MSRAMLTLLLLLVPVGGDAPPLRRVALAAGAMPRRIVLHVDIAEERGRGEAPPPAAPSRVDLRSFPANVPFRLATLRPFESAALAPAGWRIEGEADGTPFGLSTPVVDGVRGFVEFRLFGETGVSLGFSVEF